MENIENYKKIITHPGKFHADEVLAIGLLNYLGINVDIERKVDITEEEFNDPKVLILDVGRRFEAEKGNFDHHQNTDLPATNILILNHFGEKYLDYSISEILISKMKEKLFSRVDLIDRGVVTNHNQSEFNSLISMMNFMDNGFYVAKGMARDVISGLVSVCENEINGIKLWEKCLKLKGIVILNDGEFISNWKEFASKENIIFQIYKNDRGSYSLTTIDSKLYPITENTTQLFLHNAKFTATYKTKVEAINDATWLVKKYTKNKKS